MLHGFSNNIVVVCSKSVIWPASMWFVCKSGSKATYALFPGNEMQGGSTYVHCKAGRGRNTTIVLCFLVAPMLFWYLFNADQV